MSRGPRTTTRVVHRRRGTGGDEGARSLGLAGSDARRNLPLPPGTADLPPTEGLGGFCPRGARRVHRAQVAALLGATAVVVSTLTFYFLRLEPTIRAFSPAYADRLSLIMVIMLALGFSQIPLAIFVDRQPLTVEPSPDGIRLRIPHLWRSRETRVPWSNVRRVRREASRPSDPFARYTISIALGPRSLLALDVIVEPEVVRAWEDHVSERVRDPAE